MSIIDSLIRNPGLVDEIAKQCDDILKRNKYTYVIQKKPFEQLSAKIDVNSEGHAISLDAVFWHAGMITFTECSSSRDVISFQFSGCWMSKLFLNGVSYAYHVHAGADDNGNGMDCRESFLEYLQSKKSDKPVLSAFKPVSPSFGGENVWGIITNENRCYSIIVSYDWLAVRNEKGGESLNRICKLHKIIEHSGSKINMPDLLKNGYSLSKIGDMIDKTRENTTLVRPRG